MVCPRCVLWILDLGPKGPAQKRGPKENLRAQGPGPKRGPKSIRGPKDPAQKGGPRKKIMNQKNSPRPPDSADRSVSSRRYGRNSGFGLKVPRGPQTDQNRPKNPKIHPNPGGDPEAPISLAGLYVLLCKTTTKRSKQVP